MARTDHFRAQHDKILSLAREINARLGDTIADADMLEVRRGLAKLQGLVELHLAMEDKSLYPSLLKHGDQKVVNVAQGYMTEMGSLAQTFGDFLKKWSNNALVQAHAGKFTTEARAVFNALSKRIHRENTELYVLVDDLG